MQFKLRSGEERIKLHAVDECEQTKRPPGNYSDFLGFLRQLTAKLTITINGIDCSRYLTLLRYRSLAACCHMVDWDMAGSPLAGEIRSRYEKVSFIGYSWSHGRGNMVVLIASNKCYEQQKLHKI